MDLEVADEGFLEEVAALSQDDLVGGDAAGAVFGVEDYSHVRHSFRIEVSVPRQPIPPFQGCQSFHLLRHVAHWVRHCLLLSLSIAVAIVRAYEEIIWLFNAGL